MAGINIAGINTKAKGMGTKKTKESDISEIIVMAALALAAERGWEYITLRDIAEQSGLKLAGLYDVVEDKHDVLVLFGRMIDKRVLETVGFDESSTPRERLFDILMDRYEILNDYREGLVAILESFKHDPKQVVISMPYLCRSMSWVLESAGIETAGVKGAFKTAGLTGVYLKVLCTWQKDESADLAKTMAALDKALERSERAADMFGF